MASTGASYAHIYVQQKRQEEKLKRKEEERARKNGGGVEEKLIEGSSNICGNKNNKIHPGGFVSPNANKGSSGRRND